MEPISSEIVERTWQKIGVMGPDQAPALIGDLEKSQPLILEYLMAGGEELFNQPERELMLYLGVVVWQIMKQGTPPPPEVLFEDIEKAEQGNLKMLEYLGRSASGDFSQTVETMVVNYSQPEVLRYVVEALYEPDEDPADPDEESQNALITDESAIRREMKGIIFVILKTIIDSLNQGNDS